MKNKQEEDFPDVILVVKKKDPEQRKKRKQKKNVFTQVQESDGRCVMKED